MEQAPAISSLPQRTRRTRRKKVKTGTEEEDFKPLDIETPASAAAIGPEEEQKRPAMQKLQKNFECVYSFP